MAAHQAGLTTGSFWPDLLIESLAWLPYYVLFHASRWQATPGKRAFGIKVTDLHARRIGVGRSFGRYVATYLSAFALMIGYLMVPFTRKRQAMHDMIAGTLVLDAAAEPGSPPPDRAVMELPARVVAAVASVFALFLLYLWVTAFVVPAPQEHDLVAEGTPAGPAAGPPMPIAYALYEYPYFGGVPRLREEGTRAYRLDEVRVRQAPGFDAMRQEKRLAITQGFVVVVQVHREPAVQGFGMQLAKDHGFSWEWFDRVGGGYEFRKRQGPGRIQVRIDTIDGLEEVGEILFLEDVTLRVDRNFLVPFTGPATDHLVVKKGSVLRLSPPGRP